MIKEIKVGDMVLLEGETVPQKVTYITTEIVEITRTLKVPYIRLYFDRNHKPVYSHKVKEIINVND